jgi:DNA-binding HxlR family transcriptional regulator
VGEPLGTLLERPARFGELAKAIPGITESMISVGLGEFQETGLVEREVLEGPPVATVYRLTAAGRELEPALRALIERAERHMRRSRATASG